MYEPGMRQRMMGSHPLKRTHNIMTVLLQHKARIVVVLTIMMMTIGLSSCAETVTGTENLKTETAIESIVQESPSTQLSEQPQPLPAADSLKAGTNGLIPKQNGRKLVDRF